MRNKKVFKTTISVLTAFMLIFTVAFTAMAADEAPDEGLGTLTPPAETIETEVVIDPTASPATEEPEYDFDDTEETEYIEETEEPTQPPTYYEVHGDELPTVPSEEIVLPTHMEIPEEEVSDSSLLGGVIAWLCVAFGIAVIAGVLFSQRTRQNTSNNNQKNNRRK